MEVQETSVGLPCLPCKSPLAPLDQQGNRGETMANKVRWFCARELIELTLPARSTLAQCTSLDVSRGGRRIASSDAQHASGEKTSFEGSVGRSYAAGAGTKADGMLRKAPLLSRGSCEVAV